MEILLICVTGTLVLLILVVIEGALANRNRRKLIEKALEKGYTADEMVKMFGRKKEEK